MKTIMATNVNIKQNFVATIENISVITNVEKNAILVGLDNIAINYLVIILIVKIIQVY